MKAVDKNNVVVVVKLKSPKCCKNKFTMLTLKSCYEKDVKVSGVNIPIFEGIIIHNATSFKKQKKM